MIPKWDKVRQRMCTRKRRFARKQRALDAGHDQNLRAYECLFCHWWHLTGRDARQFESEWIWGRL